MNSILFKKLLSLLLAAVMLLTLPLTVFAAEAEPAVYTENGYQFIIEETENGPALRDVVYVGYETYADSVFLPETLGGLPVTPDVIDGITFTYSWYRIQSVRVSAGNPYFKTVNGALYSKDGKKLVYMYNRDNDAILTIPEGVEIVGNAAVRDAQCLVLPDSVAVIEDENGALRQCVIAADTGTAAEAFALENGCRFIPLNAEHSHAWFRGSMLREATCTESGMTELLCPCGAVKPVELQPLDHDFYGYYDESIGAVYWYCGRCGKTPEEVYGESYHFGGYDADCDCVCHRFDDSVYSAPTGGNMLQFLRDFLYRLRIVFWRLTGTHQYCACGKRHY